MDTNKFYTFSAIIEKIGINPFVFIPDKILENIFKQAGKNKGYIRVHGFINETAFEQTLVKYSGYWRLYINTSMLKDSPKKIGISIKIRLAYNPKEKEKPVHDGFNNVLNKNKKALDVFNQLSPSAQNEITRYIANLKSKESVERNIKRAIDFLLGKGRFVGRNKPT